MQGKGEEALIQEIRINSNYSHLGYSDYDKNTSKNDSKPIIQTKSILTTDFTKRLTKSLNDDLIIYPPNCRYVEQTDKGTLVLIEEPPALRTIRVSINVNDMLTQLRNEHKLEAYGYNNYKASDAKKGFNLAFPYIIFLWFFNGYNEFVSGEVYLRTQQITGFSDELLKVPLLNVGSDGGVCFGNGVYGKHQSLYAAVINSINVWWSAEFNSDIKDSFNKYRQVPIINNYLEWQYHSRVDPMFIFNVDWISANKNIYQAIQKTKERSATHTRNHISYGDIVKIFTKPLETGKEKKPTPRSRKTYKLYYDICSSVYLTKDIILSVGDPLTMKDGETAFLYSFIGFATGGDVKYVQFERNGKLFSMVYDSPFKKFMIEQIEKYRFAQELTLKNGETVKPGDILIIKIGINKTYKKIEYIRKGRIINGEQVYEMKCGSNYYLSDVDAEIFNIKTPTISGIEIEKDKTYFYIKETTTHSPLVPTSLVKFLDVDVTSSGQVITKFQNIGYQLEAEKYNIRLDMERKIPTIIETEKMRPLDGIFRLGRNFYCSKRNNKILSNSVWAHNGTVFYESLNSLVKPSPSETKQLIQDDTFSIQGPDFDTVFKIGDKVVVADWTKPIEILNVRTIQGFKHDSDYGSISFILESKDKKLSEIEYLDGRHGYINTGFIRRVTNQFEKLSVGTKIIAKESGIANFPKKDTNIIVAILIDGPYEPLVLCSNGCTLWYSTVKSRFQKVSMKAKKWEKLKHVPLDISKIKFQAGDIINGRRDYYREGGYLIFDPSTTRYLKVMPISYYGGYPEHHTFDKYFSADAMFESIPLPRLTPAQQMRLGTIKGFYDFHGGVINDPYNRSILPFINDRGGIDV